MGVAVHINLSGVDRKLNQQALIRGRKAMANDALSAMSKYVPKLEGHLRNSAAIALDGSAIYYHTPYARAQFYGFINNRYGGPFRIYNYTTTEKTPPDYVNTSRRWDLRLKGNKDDMKAVKEALIRGMLWNHN